ncbi:hypothetical protein [Bacillus cereus]|uniref:hypothetical protein n=1 Tax=Bacillus cereus TaxID=1396 RepID=UPI000BFA92AE|nr:hypothetical protein [Bacillus cereus]PES12360.1 hypothetical protein CN494_19260 [Bacillus cereus]PEX16959.1 hypothetical protein CN452_24925 [Bacillus cereus]PFC35602.1 hypothetical protein CN310_22455 [Bacillus cereus]PFQ72068.1 hypothetical protein COK15_29345 [Bacillus cereus]PFU10149.1 hypothetical protein COK79_21760 [Bacillus cereus]
MQKKQIVLLSCFVFLSILFFGGYLLLNDGGKNVFEEQSLSGKTEQKIEVKNERENESQNKYYFVYLKQDNGVPDTTFIPEKLNPGFDKTASFNTHIEFDDHGNIIQDEKMIVIYNNKLSENNKKKIENIAGKQNYAEALKEIQQRIDETKATDFNSDEVVSQ